MTPGCSARRNRLGDTASEGGRTLRPDVAAICKTGRPFAASVSSRSSKKTPHKGDEEDSNEWHACPLAGGVATAVLVMPKHVLSLPSYARIFHRIEEFCRTDYSREMLPEAVRALPGLSLPNVEESTTMASGSQD